METGLGCAPEESDPNITRLKLELQDPIGLVDQAPDFLGRSWTYLRLRRESHNRINRKSIIMGHYWISSGRRLASDEWFTPRWIIDGLGSFDLDPCTSDKRPWDISATNYTLADDGLSKVWIGRVWVNPPFGKPLSQWISRLSKHGNGIGLMPLRSTDARWFHESIWNTSTAVFFILGRIKFCGADGRQSGSCPHASLLVAFGKENAAALRKANFAGKFLELRA